MSFTPDNGKASGDMPNFWAEEVFKALTDVLPAAEKSAIVQVLESNGLISNAGQFSGLRVPADTPSILKALTVVIQERAIKGFGPRNDFTGSLTVDAGLDIADCFSPGSIVLGDDGSVYVCLSNALGAAVWLPIFEEIVAQFGGVTTVTNIEYTAVLPVGALIASMPEGQLIDTEDSVAPNDVYATLWYPPTNFVAGNVFPADNLLAVFYDATNNATPTTFSAGESITFTTDAGVIVTSQLNDIVVPDFDPGGFGTVVAYVKEDGTLWHAATITGGGFIDGPYTIENAAQL